MSIIKLKRLAYTRNVLKEHMQYMKSGVYVPLRNMRTYTLRESASNRTVLGYQFGNDLKMKIIRFLFKVCCKDVGMSSDIQGTVFYVNNNIPNPKRIKIFDYDRKIVLVKYRDEEVYKQELQIYSTVAKYFGNPKVLKNNSEEKIIYEELIERDLCVDYDDSIKNMMFVQIVQMYCKFFKERFSQKGESKSDFPRCLQHNDLSSLNIIFDEQGECHIIDWEHCDENVFFYDIFRWIINDAQQEKDVYLLKSYLDGRYDKQLNTLFSLAGCAYDVQKRVEYLDFTYDVMMNMGQKKNDDWSMWEKMRDDFKSILSELK